MNIRFIKHMLMASIAVRMVAVFDNDTCEVVTVKGADGKPLRINKSDYDEKTHGKPMTGKDAEAANAGQQTAGDVPQPPPGAIVPPAPSAPNFGTGSAGNEGGPTPVQKDAVKGAAVPPAGNHDTVYILPEGKGKSARFYLVDATGTKIEHALIDAKGYETQEAAQAALDEYKRNIPH